MYKQEFSKKQLMCHSQEAREEDFIMCLWMIEAIVAHFVKGLCGFANKLVFTTILSFGVSNASERKTRSRVDLRTACSVRSFTDPEKTVKMELLIAIFSLSTFTISLDSRFR